jgi:hypothetical protein
VNYWRRKLPAGYARRATYALSIRATYALSIRATYALSIRATYALSIRCSRSRLGLGQLGGQLGRPPAPQPEQAAMPARVPMRTRASARP